MERAQAIKAAVETMAVAIPDEGIESINLPIHTFNAMCDGLRELMRLIKDERMNNSRRQMAATKVMGDTLAAGLAPIMPPEPEPTIEERQRKATEQAIRAKELQVLLTGKGRLTGE
jgi:hypothetical protein